MRFPVSPVCLCGCKLAPVQASTETVTQATRTCRRSDCRTVWRVTVKPTGSETMARHGAHVHSLTLRALAKLEG